MASDELVLDGVALDGADYAGLRPSYVSVAGSRLVRCDFRRTRITSGGLGDGAEASEYVECVFDGSSIRNVIPGRATFIGCSFLDVKIRNVMFLEAQFVDCVFSGELRDVTFTATPVMTERLGRSTNAFEGNDFREARLRNVSFRGGIDLDRQWLPEAGFLVVRDAATVIEQVREQVGVWPEAELRADAQIRLDVLAENCRRGQRDLFVEKEFLGLSAETADRLAALFTHVSPG